AVPGAEAVPKSVGGGTLPVVGRRRLPGGAAAEARGVSSSAAEGQDVPATEARCASNSAGEGRDVPATEARGASSSAADGLGTADRDAQDRGPSGWASDDLGNRVGLAGRPRRVVSLVPSLTEALAVTEPALLVGATDYCTHPADLDVARVGG